MTACGIYVHVPFCARKCRYCDFYSLPFDSALSTRYVGALLCQLAGAGRRAAASIFFGGGTPSLLEAADVARVIDAVARRMDLAPAAEITLELNPETAAPEKLRALKAAGVNRLSVGVQSTDDAVLRAIGRRHTAAQAVDAVLAARRAGFDNISADVIIGLPGETRASFNKTLSALTSLPLSHISAYMLTLAPGTPMGSRPPENLPDDDAQAVLYETCVDTLARQGFDQYEISNFTRPGFESRHNLLYWHCGDYYGLGPAAHSSLGSKRYSMPPDLDSYLLMYENSRPVPFAQPLAFEGDVTASDYIMLRLRTTTGLSLRELYDTYNCGFDETRLEAIRRFERAGLMRTDGDTLRLTTAGMLVSNTVLCRLIE